MSVHFNDLTKLKDIFDDLEPNNYDKINDKDIEDFKEGIQYFITDYIETHIEKYKEKDFETVMFEDLCKLIKQTYKDIYITDYFQDENIYEYTVWDAIQIYLHKHNAFRSYCNTNIVNKPDVESISNKLKSYENMEQPEQQSKEWFEFRREGLSASDLYKAIDTQAKQNQLILSKCLPIDFSKKFSTNINSACHNGHRYEPLSIMHYEKDFNTIVGEFGCIRHQTHKFLRASPDGINIDPKNLRYGRLVEVKNPTSRQLDGIPEKAYWVQMQLQMEVWDLDECDFLETTFKEYETEEDFKKDGNTFMYRENKMRKGIIVQFYHNSKPHYEYPPVDISEEEFNKWYDEILEQNNEMAYIKNIYWYLQDYSCVLVPRNKKWFNSIFPKLQQLWNTVLEERTTGYEHRRPKKKNKKIVDEVSQNIVIKVRTESFSESNKQEDKK
tara:strand:- start:2051 stop:3373 length:1323 start_codon:yes stop_codon:yes gene_type:complete